MAKTYTISRFLGVKGGTTWYECPLGSGYKFEVKADNDPKYQKFLRKQGNPMERAAHRAFVAMSVAREQGEFPEHLEEATPQEQIMHFGAVDLGEELLAQVNSNEKAERAAQLIVSWKGVEGFDDDVNNGKPFDVKFSHKAAVELLEQPHGLRIEEGEYEGKTIDQVWLEGIFATAHAGTLAQKEAVEEQAKN